MKHIGLTSSKGTMSIGNGGSSVEMKGVAQNPVRVRLPHQRNRPGGLQLSICCCGKPCFPNHADYGTCCDAGLCRSAQEGDWFCFLGFMSGYHHPPIFMDGDTVHSIFIDGDNPRACDRFDISNLKSNKIPYQGI